jgi:adenylate cyclase
MTPGFRVPATRRLPVLLALAVAAAISVADLGWPTLFARLDYAAYDLMTSLSGSQSPTGRVVVVEIDEQSLASIGQWPWRRDLLARFVATLLDAGASAIAFDVVFAELDRHASPDRDPDGAFAKAIGNGRVVLGYAFTFGSTTARDGSCPAHPLSLVTLHADAAVSSDLFQASGAVCNLSRLTEAVSASGFLNAGPDADGILRRLPVLIEFEGRVYPSLALAAVLMATGSREPVLRIDGPNIASLIVNDRVVRLDGKGNVLLRYRGPKNTFARISATDVIDGLFAPDAFRGRIAIVGATALGERGTLATPTDRLFNGVEVQATAADNLLRGDVVYRPQFAPVGEALLAVAFALAIGIVVARRGPSGGGLTTAIAVGGTWFAAVRLLSTYHALLSPVIPTLGGMTALAAAVLAFVAGEHRRADRASSKLAESRRLMVQSLLSLTEMRDETTGLHSRRTQAYARLLAERLAKHPRFRQYLTPDRIELFASLAVLHDIGKVGVPDALLNKPGILTVDEMGEMRKHASYGRTVIMRAEEHVGVRDDDVLEMAKEIVYTHHERWDGRGYPNGLQGEEIPIPGRLMMLVDVYDAVTGRRVYHQPLSHEAARSMILSGRGTYFEPAVVDAFLDIAPAFERVLLDGAPPDSRSAAA